MKGEYSSYKDFPVLLYQIQTKYRDEARPRAGILRGREFVMKDSYSFDVDDDGLKTAYHAHREAYQRIFDRLGGALRDRLGGVRARWAAARRRSSWPRARSARTPSCAACESGYAANVEAVITAVPEPLPIDGLPDADGARHPRHPDHRDAGRLGQLARASGRRRSPPRTP